MFVTISMAQSRKYVSHKKKIKYSDSKEASTEKVTPYLKAIVCLVVEQGLGRTRASILTKQLSRYGGRCCRKLDKYTTHILVGNSIKLEKLPKILKVKENEIRDDVEIVRADWLSLCLKEGKLVDLSPDFRLRQEILQIHSIKTDTTVATLCDSGKKEECSPVTTPVSSNVEGPTSSDDVEMNSIKKQINNEKKVSRKQKREVHTDESSDSDYINSDDEKTEKLSSSGDDARDELSEIAPRISPHKKVWMNKIHDCHID